MKAFFLAIKHDQLTELLRILIQYVTPGEKYIISKETSEKTHQATQGQHFHFFLENMETNKYDQFIRKVKAGWGLKGQAAAGTGRQYGAVRKIRDTDLMKAYMLKDISGLNMAQYDIEPVTIALINDMVQKTGYCSNYAPDKIQEWDALSYKAKKNKWEDFIERVKDYLENKWPGDKEDFMTKLTFHHNGTTTTYYETKYHIDLTHLNRKLLKEIVKIYYEIYDRIITKSGFYKVLMLLGLINEEYLIDQMNL